MAVKRCQHPDHKGPNLLTHDDFAWSKDDVTRRKPFCVSCSGDKAPEPVAAQVEVKNEGEDKNERPKPARAKQSDSK